MILTPPEIKKIIGCVLLLILANTAVYFNSLKGAFQFDDLPLIQSHWVEDLDAFDRQVRFSSFENRPVVLWTYALNNTLGKNRVFGFHLFNLTVHIGVTLLIFFLISRTQYLTASRQRQLGKNSNAIAEGVEPVSTGRGPAAASGFPLATALLFALHPLNTDSVSYISSRSSLLVTFFYLLALYLFTGLFSRKNKIPKFNLRWVLFIAILISAYMSIASKLIGATLPVLMGIWYLGFIVSTQKPQFAEKIFQLKWGLFLGVFFAGAYIVANSWLYIAKDQGLELYGRMPYFLVQIKVIVFYYLKLFLFPFNLNVDSGLPFSTPASDPLIFLAGLVIIGIFFTVARGRNIWVAVGFIWFFITLAPTSSIIPLNDLAVEHRTYLPMTLGLCMIVGWGARTWRCLMLLVLLPMFALGTATRNNDWISEISLWKDSVQKNPKSTRSHNNLGKAYFEKGDLALATHHLEKSVANISHFIDTQYNIKSAEEFLKRREKITGQKSVNKFSPSESIGLLAELVEPHYNLASVYLDQGRLDDAEKEYLKTLALRPGHFSSRIGLSSVYNRKGLYDQAIASLKLAINLSNSDPGFALARLNLGELYGKTGKIENAVTEWEAALKIDPSLLPAYFNLGTAYMVTDKFELAVSTFKHCLKLNSRYEPALFNLAKVYQKQEKWDTSTRQFKSFLEVTGPRPSAYAQIGFNFNRQADWENAQDFLEKSLSLQPNNFNAQISLAETLANLGQMKKARELLQTALKMDLSPAQNEAINKMMVNLTGPQNATP